MVDLDVYKTMNKQYRQESMRNQCVLHYPLGSLLPAVFFENHVIGVSIHLGRLNVVLIRKLKCNYVLL
jgi:hypothetical protein